MKFKKPVGKSFKLKFPTSLCLCEQNMNQHAQVDTTRCIDQKHRRWATCVVDCWNESEIVLRYKQRLWI